jgi:hypothetical protein
MRDDGRIVASTDYDDHITAPVSREKVRPRRRLMTRSSFIAAAGLIVPGGRWGQAATMSQFEFGLLAPTIP